ncbi:MAG: response regulator [Candidatus Margulisiibacteriota bacterium]|jgi:signal transduction histidine kinase/ActR/RegA family two-component response regulator
MSRLSSIIIEKAHLSKATLRQEFAAYTRRLFWERLNILLYLGIIIIPIISWIDASVAPQLAHRFFVYRAVSIILAMIFLLIVHSRWGRKSVHILAYLCVITLSIQNTNMVLELGGESSSYYVALIITMLGILTILPLTLSEAVVQCTIAFAIYLGGIMIFDHNINNLQTLLNHLFFIIGSFAMLCSAAYFDHRSRFQEFELRRELNESQAQLKGYADNLEKMVAQKTQEKLKLEQQMMQMQKMEAFGTMAGGIAHDFNNILWTVLGYSSFIRTIRAEDKELNDHLDVIENSARQATSLTKQLLAFSRKDTHAFKPLDLGEIVQEAAVLLEKSIKHNVSFATEIGHDLSPVEADANQIEQAIINLGLNADQAMPNGGSLTIKAHNISLRHNQTEIPAGKYVCVTIIDTGQGIPEDIRLKVFEPFFTTKPEGKGTGLGLSMVYRMVQNHNGFVHLDSIVNNGTTFSLYFPASNKESVSIKTQKEAVSLTKGEGTILIVDNEEPLRRILSKILQSIGYSTLEAESGKEALEIFEQKGADIDLIILDMHMPQMNGYEVFSKLQKLAPKVKVIISSGYIDGEEVQEMLASGAAGVLPKPYSATDISRKVHQALNS